MIELTEEQKAKLEEYRDKWRAICLSTEPADRGTAEEAIREIYRHRRRPVPSIVWRDSPAGLPRVKRDSPYRCERVNVAFDLGKVLSQFAISQIFVVNWGLARIDALVHGSLHSRIRVNAFGQGDTWLCGYDYCRQVLGLTAETDSLVPYMTLARSLGRCTFYDSVCVATERYCSVLLDSRSLLHNAEGPAITYPDGWRIYAYHGVLMPKRVIEQRHKISVKDIEKEQNVEIRRVMVELYGQERYIRKSGARLIAKDEYGELYEKSMRRDEPIVMVKVINSTPEPDGSYKEYWLRVDPECRPLLPNGSLGRVQNRTPRNAIASTFGLCGKQYRLKKET